MPLYFQGELSLGDIIRHIRSREKRIRCIIEGEEVLNAHHIICCGVKACSTQSVTVQDLCVQTSHVKNTHELEFVYERDSSIKVRDRIFARFTVAPA